MGVGGSMKRFEKRLEKTRNVGKQLSKTNDTKKGKKPVPGVI